MNPEFFKSDVFEVPAGVLVSSRQSLAPPRARALTARVRHLTVPLSAATATAVALGATLALPIEGVGASAGSIVFEYKAANSDQVVRGPKVVHPETVSHSRTKRLKAARVLAFRPVGVAVQAPIRLYTSPLDD